MSKFNRFQKIVIGCIAFFLAIGVFLEVLNIQNPGYNIFALIKYSLIDAPVKTLQHWTNDFADLSNVQNENEQLRKQMAETPFKDAQLEEANRRIAELEGILDMQSSLLNEGYPCIQAEVIMRDMEQWNNVLTINKGTSDGIVEDMVVVNQYGVVGKVMSASQYVSKVKLLTSQDKLNSVSIKISVSEEKTIEGILQNYDINKGMYVIHMFEDSDEIAEDMDIITSGKGGVYPSGLLIGKVKSVEALDSQVGKIVYAQPVDDFQTFDIVTVIGNPDYK